MKPAPKPNTANNLPIFFKKIISNSYLSILQPQIKIYTNDINHNLSTDKQIIILNSKLNANLSKYKKIFFFSSQASNFLNIPQQDIKDHVWLPPSNVVDLF